MSNNKAVPVKVSGYGAIYSNDEAANIFYIVCFISFLYTPLEYVESDGNKFASGDLVCDSIYTSPGRHKSRFYVEPYKKQKL